MINITDPAAKARYHAEMLRQMAVLENRYAKQIRKVLNCQYMDVAKRISEGALYGFDDLVDGYGLRFRYLLTTQYRQIATIFSKKVYKVIEEGKEKGLGFPSEVKTPKDEFWNNLNRWMRTQAAQKVRRIHTTTKRKITDVIQKGMSEGESHREIAKRIRKAGYIANPKRALTIARTETHTCGIYSVQKSVESTRLKTEREWSASMDERVRADHASANGQRAKEGEPYTIGGVKMMYPGDPKGGASQVINCRCVELFHTVRLGEHVKPPKPVYSPAKTIEEAETWAVKNLKAKKAVYKGLDLNVVNEVNKSIFDLQGRFPKAQFQEIRAVKATSKGIAKFDMLTTTEAPPTSAKTISTLKINKASQYFKGGRSLKEINNDIKKGRDQGWWVPENIKQMVVHESAHALTFNGLSAREMLRRANILKLFSFSENKLGRYATTNGVEGIAETVAKYVRDGNIQGVKFKYSDQSVKEVIRKFLGITL